MKAPVVVAAGGKLDSALVNLLRSVVVIVQTAPLPGVAPPP
jgi:hypothetical protein